MKHDMKKDASDGYTLALQRIQNELLPTAKYWPSGDQDKAVIG